MEGCVWMRYRRWIPVMQGEGYRWWIPAIRGCPSRHLPHRRLLLLAGDRRLRLRLLRLPFELPRSRLSLFGRKLQGRGLSISHVEGGVEGGRRVCQWEGAGGSVEEGGG